MSSALEARILKLEQRQAAGATCFVAHRGAHGSLRPATPGARLAPCFAVLPEVSATTEEWLRQHAPAVLNA